MAFLVPNTRQLAVRAEYVSGKRVAEKPVFSYTEKHYKTSSLRLLRANASEKNLEFVDA
jgi:hypothetical protein